MLKLLSAPPPQTRCPNSFSNFISFSGVQVFMYLLHIYLTSLKHGPRA